LFGLPEKFVLKPRCKKPRAQKLLSSQKFFAPSGTSPLNGLSSFLRTRLASESAELETQHRDLTEKLAASEPRTIKLRFRDTRRFVETRLQDLQSMFDGEPRLVRAEIARHVQKITLKPVGKGYIASGVWDWLGGVAVRMVPGARIELATPAFSGRRSTNELPRHTTLVV
jgi:hypothetical protein